MLRELEPDQQRSEDDDETEKEFGPGLHGVSLRPLLLHEEGGEALGPPGGDSTLVQARQTFERQYILRALERSRWNQSNAARLLGIHRNTLLQKMKALNICENGSDST